MSDFIDGWISDARGNRCSAAYFRSEDAAAKALASLKNCDNCTNCSRCSGCYDCSGCSRCSGCYDCYDCSGCSGCSHVASLGNKQGIIAEPTLRDPGVPPIPRIDNIHQKPLAAVSQPEAFDMGSWHTCETTHCRAGWIVTLAGEAGKALETFHNPELAAMLIYRESGYHINPGRFYDSNDVAMADIQRLADEEKAAQ